VVKATIEGLVNLRGVDHYAAIRGKQVKVNS
jgi:hypothetical protein